VEKFTKAIYILSISAFIIGLRIALTWSYNSRLLGLFLICISAFLVYINYYKNHDSLTNTSNINLKQASFGIILILIDISYNIIASDTFRYFDYGVIIAGLMIILLNLNIFSFLKLSSSHTSFITYFLFITMILYGSIFSGLPFLLGNDDNILFELFTSNVVNISGNLLNFFKPTAINGQIINFDGFSVGIGNACSGIESISVFMSSVIAYMLAIKNKNFKLFIKYLLFGGILLYTLNIIRILMLVLIGYYYGVDNMLFAHYNIGWIFFVIGMSVFWYFALDKFELE
jgi:archaeosortase C (PEF-CTERM variant)